MKADENIDKKLEELAKESKENDDFKKMDEMEKEYHLDESPEAKGEEADEGESKLEKRLEDMPIWPPGENPGNPINPGNPY